MQSEDLILVPLVTIGHHQLLEKEKWKRMIEKVTLRRSEGDVKTQIPNTQHADMYLVHRLWGFFSRADMQHIHIASLHVQRMCNVHTQHIIGVLFAHKET